MNHNVTVDESQLKALKAEVQSLPPALRRAVAAGWARDAQYEHASIASFARFSLSLLAVGAPSDLVARTHQAALDEVQHARLCFGLASVYGGSPVGPAALHLDASTPIVESDLTKLAQETVLEGCINETAAAMEAGAALRKAQPATVRHVLVVIQRDEQTHAELAFAFVGWAAQVGGTVVAKAVLSTVQNVLDAATELQPQNTGTTAEQAPHGRLADAERVAIRQYSLQHHVAPALRSALQPFVT